MPGQDFPPFPATHHGKSIRQAVTFHTGLLPASGHRSTPLSRQECENRMPTSSTKTLSRPDLGTTCEGEGRTRVPATLTRQRMEGTCLVTNFQRSLTITQHAIARQAKTRHCPVVRAWSRGVTNRELPHRSPAPRLPQPPPRSCSSPHSDRKGSCCLRSFPSTCAGKACWTRLSRGNQRGKARCPAQRWSNPHEQHRLRSHARSIGKWGRDSTPGEMWSAPR